MAARICAQFSDITRPRAHRFFSFRCGRALRARWFSDVCTASLTRWHTTCTTTVARAYSKNTSCSSRSRSPSSSRWTRATSARKSWTSSSRCCRLFAFEFHVFFYLFSNLLSYYISRTLRVCASKRTNIKPRHNTNTATTSTPQRHTNDQRQSCFRVVIRCDLGIHIDADLVMRTHVQKTVSRCFAVLRQLRQIRRSVP